MNFIEGKRHGKTGDLNNGAFNTFKIFQVRKEQKKISFVLVFVTAGIGNNWYVLKYVACVHVMVIQGELFSLFVCSFFFAII